MLRGGRGQLSLTAIAARQKRSAIRSKPGPIK